jgi:hypothetical protein
MSHLQHDVLVAPVWLAANVLLCIAAWRTASRLFPGDSVGQRVGHAVLLGWAAVVLSAIALGSVGQLRPVLLLAAVAALAAVALVVVARTPSPSRTGASRAGGPGPAAIHAEEPADPAGEAIPSGPVGSLVWPFVWVAVFALALSHVVAGGVLRFPADWDTLMYHLPLVDYWLQAKSLYPSAAHQWSVPGNNELVALWVVAPFSGDFLYALNNLPAALLLAWATVELGRLAGLDEPCRHLAGLAVAANFVVVRQLTNAENDVAVAALVLSFLAYGIRYAVHRRVADLVVGSMAFGLLAGVKFYALGYAAGAATVLAVLIARRQGLRAAVLACLAGLAGFAALGGYWYLRNWLVGGAWLYPLGSTPKPDELDRVYPALWQSTFAGNASPGLFRLAAVAVWDMAGPFHLIALLALPISLTWLLASGWFAAVGRTPSASSARLLLATATLASGGVLLVTPGAVEDAPGTLNQLDWKYCPVRYGCCFLSLALLSLAVLANDLLRAVAGGGARLSLRATPVGGSPTTSLQQWPSAVAAAARAGAIAVIAGGIGYQVFAPYDRLHVDPTEVLLLTANAVVWVAIVSAGSKRFRLHSTHRVVVGFALGALGVACGVGALSERWHKGYIAHFDRTAGHGVFASISRELAPGESVCVLDSRPYPFFGPARQYHVCQPPYIRSARGWAEFLRSKQVALVVARFDPNQGWFSWHYSASYFAGRPDLFESLKVERSPYSIYRPTGLAPSDDPGRSARLHR